jgi:hypothetical protein
MIDSHTPEWLADFRPNFDVLFATISFDVLNELRCQALHDADLTNPAFVFDRVEACEDSVTGEVTAIGGVSHTSVQSGLTGQQFSLFENLWMQLPDGSETAHRCVN